MTLKTQRPDSQRRQMVRRVQKGLRGASCNCASRYSLAVDATRGKCACQDGMNIFFLSRAVMTPQWRVQGYRKQMACVSVLVLYSLSKMDNSAMRNVTNVEDTAPSVV